MAGRIRTTALERGVSADGVAGLVAAFRAAAEPRLAGPYALGSERHPDLLHPGRTVLILLDDLGEVDPRVLAVGALAETRRPELRVEPAVAEEILRGIDPGVTGRPSASDPELTGRPAENDESASRGEAYGWWRALPAPVWLPVERGGRELREARDGRDETGSDADSALLEALVVAPRPVQRVVLAEGLDFVRHAHLRDDRAERERAVELGERVFCPIASRVHDVLDRRFTWWMRRVGRTLQLR